MSGYIREVVEVSQGELTRIADERGAVYVGSAKDCHSRADGHEQKGFSGVMYAAKTSNMMHAEDKLLEYGHRHNSHQWSGAQQSPGYVYAIKGTKATSSSKSGGKSGRR